jgi:hypothetical protein
MKKRFPIYSGPRTIPCGYFQVIKRLQIYFKTIETVQILKVPSARYALACFVHLFSHFSPAK